MSTFNEAFDLRTLPEIMCSEQFELRQRNQTRCDAGRLAEGTLAISERWLMVMPHANPNSSFAKCRRQRKLTKCECVPVLLGGVGSGTLCFCIPFCTCITRGGWI